MSVKPAQDVPTSENLGRMEIHSISKLSPTRASVTFFGLPTDESGYGCSHLTVQVPTEIAQTLKLKDVFELRKVKGTE